MTMQWSGRAPRTLASAARLATILATILWALSATPAAAVPAFARQTGEPCQTCHVGGFGPQLTPFGRNFKMHGYTLRTDSFNVPLAAMAVASYLRTQKAQNPAPPGGSPNNNWALDQFSLFFAAGFGQHFGAFVQGTYDGVAKQWSWDNLDLRAVDDFKAGKHDVTVGASLNNNPTVQDPWNTTPAWGFPYTASALAPAPTAAPVINGALAQQALGLTGYAWVDGMVYLEGGAYWSPSARALSDLGVDPTEFGAIHGAAPYGRAAIQWEMGPGEAELGALAFRTEIFPGLDRSTGFVDRYTDLGVDGSYIATFGNGDVVALNARYVDERQRLSASCALAGAPLQGCADNDLQDFRVDGSYYWRHRYGVTVEYFNTTGSANPVIYAANRTFTPDSAGVNVQLDTTLFPNSNSPLGPRFNARIGVQYTGYAEFNGAGRNFDGFGANARDNNAVRVFIWAAD
ncbi:MAG TPA: hypothetical protein VN694_12110 [Caulobacteraceae bacterium]|nr:hypothetical protein [Caulobacteraceae bacterium]